MISLSFPETPQFIQATISYLETLLPATEKNDVAAPATEIIHEAAPATKIIHEAAPATEKNTGEHVCPVTGEILDKVGGYPWDERIHSSKRSKLAKSKEWKLIRNIEEKAPGLVEEVKAEFDAKRNGETPSAPVGTQRSLFEAPENPPAANIPPPPVAEPEPIELFALPEMPVYTDIISFITCRLAANDNFQKGVDRCLQKFDLREIVQLAHMTPEVIKLFGDWVSWEWDNLDD